MVWWRGIGGGANGDGRYGGRYWGRYCGGGIVGAVLGGGVYSRCKNIIRYSRIEKSQEHY